MSIRRPPVLFLVAVILVAALLAVLFPSRRRQVRKTFARVEQLAAKDGATSPVTAALRMKGLSDLLDDETTLLLPGEEREWTLSRKEARALMTKGWLETRYVSVRFDAIRITFPDRDTAETTGDITIESGSSRLDHFEDVPTFEATLVREAGTRRWRFSRVVLRPIIEK